MSGLQKLTPLGDFQITALVAAVGLGTIPAEAKAVFLQAEGQAVRWRGFGLDPTATLGTRLLADDDFLYTGDLSKFRVIEEAVGGILNISFYTW